MNRFLGLLLAAACWSCANTSTEKHLGKRDKIVDVRDKVVEIKMDDDVLISNHARFYPMDDYLMISDYQSRGKQIYVFDRNNFRYLTGTADKGEGPTEITSIGTVGVDEANRSFYVVDMGKDKLFSFELDSILANPQYRPKVKQNLNHAVFPLDLQYISDTLCFSLIGEPIGNADFKLTTGKWNMLTGEIELMKYNHPDIKRRLIRVAASMKHGIYVETYQNHDLLSIFTLDGELKYNIYGRKWDTQKTNRYDFYGTPIFCGDKILVSFSDGTEYDTTGRQIHPTQFLVFDTKGEYIRTLETGYVIAPLQSCYDEKNNRLLMVLNDEIQFAYLPLDGLI
jgi:hypothetical protein